VADTRNGGAGATPPLYSGSSNNPQPRNPRCDPVTVDPRAAPTQAPPGRAPVGMPIGGPDRGLKPLGRT
jgi:hypothetical protein